MSVRGEPFDNLRDRIIDDYKVEIKPKEQKSKEVAVNNLRGRIIDNYRSENATVKKRAFPLGAEKSDLLPLSNRVETSAAVIQPKGSLPLDILKYMFQILTPKEFQATSQVSKFWGYASLETAKTKQTALVKSLIQFFCNHVENLKPETRKDLLQLTENINPSKLAKWIDLKDLLLDKRERVLKFMPEVLSNIKDMKEGQNLLSLIKLKEKPIFFDDLLTLSTIKSLIDLAEQPKYAWKNACLKSAAELCCDMLDFKRAEEIANKMGSGKTNTLSEINKRKLMAFKKLEIKS